MLLKVFFAILISFLMSRSAHDCSQEELGAVQHPYTSYRVADPSKYLRYTDVMIQNLPDGLQHIAGGPDGYIIISVCYPRLWYA